MRASSLFFVLFLLSSTSLFGQQKGNQSPQQTPTLGGARPLANADNSTNTPPNPTQEEHLDIVRTSARFLQIQKDTKTLMQLSSELQQEVDKSSKDTMSVDVIKKAEQIEKLARSVKDRMRGY